MAGIRRYIVGSAIVALLLFGGASVANAAAIIIDFGGGVAGGSVVISGNRYTGSGILVPLVQLINTPQNAGSYTTNAVLSFVYEFGVANQVTIIGGFAPANIANGSTLMTGTFTSFNAMGTPSGIRIEGIGNDTKHRELVAFAGLPSNTIFQWNAFTLIASTNTPGTYLPFSTDVGNTAVPDAGSSLLLLGMGLVGLRMWRKR